MSDDHRNKGRLSKGPSIRPVCESECKCHGCGLFWCAITTHCDMCDREDKIERQITIERRALVLAACDLADAMDNHDRRRTPEEARRIYACEAAVRRCVSNYRAAVYDYEKVRKGL